jgi:hypothetical protein
MPSQSEYAVLVGLFVAFLTPHTTSEQVPTWPAVEVTQPEYVVFSAYINDTFMGANGEDRVGWHVSNIVIVNMTRSDLTDIQIEDENDKPFSWKRAGRFLRKQAPTLQQTTIEKLREVGTQSAPFRHSFQLPVPYQLVDAKEIDAIFDNKGWWTDYYEKYPGSQGYLVLSKVGFSADGSQALFYAENRCGGKCATGTYVVMQKSGTSWKLMKEIVIGVS